MKAHVEYILNGSVQTMKGKPNEERALGDDLPPKTTLLTSHMSISTSAPSR